MSEPLACKVRPGGNVPDFSVCVGVGRPLAATLTAVLTPRTRVMVASVAAKLGAVAARRMKRRLAWPRALLAVTVTV